MKSALPADVELFTSLCDQQIEAQKELEDPQLSPRQRRELEARLREVQRKMDPLLSQMQDYASGC